MSKYVFDMTFAVRADSSEEALEILMSATAGVELYDGGDKVEYTYIEGGEEVEDD
ncbi:MAG: hypothetical protein WC965_01130 [Thiohalomonadaceae bacterium]